ncbi:beta strand repeat-containing protein [Cellulophaga lytica]|uniref:beta strand repeat-containing protein n=1 Tax=Cellulophaga lytica TaxID=979 RepID=UPI000B5C2AA9|nr:hypothetical protein [Cellulophaga lytica]SNQ44079.1 conserved exported hypothetical protein [Cellulophaga lytica]
MKKLIFGLFLSTCLFTSIQAQVKIGENPENLHFNSVLELESTSKALVITRMSTLQMNAITPLNGAVIYNTDTRCLHYYNDTEWINLCEAENAGNINLVDNGDNTYTFTNAAGNDITFETPAFTSNHTGSGGVGFSSGIKITDDGNTVNIEVDQIHGDSILNETIGRTKIADDAIGVDELGDTSVNTNNLIDESVTPVKIQPSATPNQVLKTNATGTNVEWGTLDATNIAGQDLTVDASLEFTGSTTGVGALLETVGISVADGGITNAKLATDAVTTDKIADETILSEDILDGTIATQDIADNAITAVKINADVAGSGLTKNATTGALDVDVAALTGDGNITSTDLNVTGGANAALNNVTLEINPSAVGANELADDAVTTVKIVDANVTTVKIADDAIDNTKVADDAVQTENILDGTIATLDIADDAVTADKIGSTGAADANKILGTSAAGDPEWQNASQIAASLGEDVTSSNGSISGVAANAALAAMDLEVNVDDTTIEVDATNGLQIVAGSIDNTKLANDAVTGAKILDASIESNDIADKNITLTKLADGTTLGQLMQWDGTNWVLVDAAALTTAEADGIIGNEVTGPTDGTLAVSGTGTVADPLTLDVSADGIDTAELADNAVTTVKIADTNVTRDKIANAAIDDNKLDKANISLSGFAVPTGDLSIGSQKLTNVSDPTDAQDAATKFYVDTEISDAAAAGATALALKEDTANKSPNVNLGTSDDAFPTQNAVKTYVDTEVSALGNLETRNLSQTDALRTYNLNGNNLAFIGSGNVGIGNGANPPAQKLHVAGAIRSQGYRNSDGNAGEPSYRFNDDTDTGMYSPAADEIGFSVGGTQALNIKETSSNTTVTVREKLKLEGTIEDINNSVGTAGQVLTSTATGTEWKNPATIVMGKANGANAIKVNGATVSGGSGTNIVTFNSAMPDSNYIVNLTVVGNNRIYITAQTINGFTVEIKDNTDTSVVSEWFFTVSDF